MTTTPNEFLQFAKDMGLDQIKTTSLTNNNNNDYRLTGLSVLNNLCYLIEQIHTLKAENNRLRAHIELIKHVENFLLKPNEQKHFSTYDEDKLSRSNSFNIKNYGSHTLSISSRERQDTDFVNHPEYSSSMMHIESDMMDSNLGLSSWNNWSKVRHALKFSLRRKPEPPINSILTVPAINISVESGDDDHNLNNNSNKYQKKKKKLLTINNNRRDLIGCEDTDYDDELIELNRMHHKRKFYRNNQINSSSIEANLSMPIDDEHSFTRKKSKIANYGHKLRSKLNTVKRQFTDQNSSPTSRFFSHLQPSTLDDFGSGLTVKLAPAMTKAYQQKMREWETMQKSNFLVNYRRQSLINKTETNNNNNNNSRKTSIISTINEISDETQILSTNELIPIDQTNNILSLSPILSPNQRSLIAHQWREIMSEEITLRIYNEYFERKFQELKQLETDLKYLKTNIFCTNNQDYFLKHRSMTSIDQLDQNVLDQYRQTFLPQRCQSYQSLISMPNSWTLAVQSAAYSDILDGTSNKTTDRAILLNKNFFHQLNHFKNNRNNFEQKTFKNLPISTNSITNTSYEENLNEKRSIRTRTRIILARGHLHKVPLIFPSEIPSFHSITPTQTIASDLETSSHIDLLTSNETESNLPSSTTILNKHLKHSRFDFRKTIQRSKSMCMTHFHTWFQRRRQQYHQHSFVPRRKSAIEPKSNKELLSTPCSTPKFFGSPRLARIHQRIFRHHRSSSSTPAPSAPPPLTLSSPLDDSDQYFTKQESPVRIYLPARTSPTTRRVRIADNEIKTPPMSRITSPIINRRNLPSSTTTRE